MQTEVTTTKKQELAVPMNEAWGTEDIKTENVLIPRLALMQGQSKFVQEGVAKIGDIVDTVTGEILGSASKPIEIIPIMQFDKWTLFHKDNGQWVYTGMVDATAENSGWHREWEGKSEDGRDEKRVYSLLFYVLLANNFTALPYLVTFKSTSLKSGKALMNHFFQAKKDKVPPASRSVFIASKKEAGDKNTWYIFSIAPGKTTSKEQVATAYGWYQTLKLAKHKVADEVEEIVPSEQADF